MSLGYETQDRVILTRRKPLCWPCIIRPVRMAYSSSKFKATWLYPCDFKSNIAFISDQYALLHLFYFSCGCSACRRRVKSALNGCRRKESQISEVLSAEMNGEITKGPGVITAFVCPACHSGWKFPSARNRLQREPPRKKIMRYDIIGKLCSDKIWYRSFLWLFFLLSGWVDLEGFVL